MKARLISFELSVFITIVILQPSFVFSQDSLNISVETTTRQEVLPLHQVLSAPGADLSPELEHGVLRAEAGYKETCSFSPSGPHCEFSRGLQCIKEICQCSPNFYYDGSFGECLGTAQFHSSCRNNYDCQHNIGLGELSRCIHGYCECWDTLQQFGQIVEVRLRFGQCHYSRWRNEICHTTTQCVVGYHENAVCVPHPSYRHEKVCQCIREGICTGGHGHGDSNSTGETVVGIIIGIVALLVIISVAYKLWKGSR